MKVVFAGAIAREPCLAMLRKLPNIELVELVQPSEVVPHIPQADILVIPDPRGPDGKKIAAALSAPDSKVRFVQVVSAGTEGLLAHGVPSALPVSNQGGAVAPAVAEHAMAMILMLARRMDHIAAAITRHAWDREFDPPLVALEGKRLVIVGIGNIGRQIAKRARGFDMKIVGLSRSAKPEPLADEVHPLSKLHEELGKADIVVMAAAFAPETRNMMGPAEFAACKKGAMFINITRGGTVDQVALRAALESGQLRAAAIDVTEPEPLPENDPLWTAPNLIISPHTAGAGSRFTGIRVAEVLSENIKRVEQGQPPINQVPH